MANRTYRLRISHEGREFEAEGDKPFVLEMLKRFGPQVAAPGMVERPASAKSPSESAAPVRPRVGKSLSIREFIQQLGPKKHIDITLAFGYYLEKYQGVTEFTSADINNCYYEAKLEASNTSLMVVRNIRRGFLMPSKKSVAKGKNRYTLTTSGEQFVESMSKPSK